MTIGLVGRKCGMTRIFTDAGVTVPVTVVEALPNRISQVKTEKADGYRAVQVTLGTRRPSRVTKALAGHFAKANVAAGYASREFRLSKDEGESLAAGGELKVDMFKVGQIVDVTGTTVGKGFAGTMKRHNFAGGMKTHGNSVSHRAPGSIGQRQTPGRVFKGKRMSGHMGVRNRTIENLQDRGNRRAAQSAVDQRRRARLGRRPGDRAPVREGAGSAAPQASRAQQGAGRRGQARRRCQARRGAQGRQEITDKK